MLPILHRQNLRRFLVILLVLLGAILIFLATEAMAGMLLVALGILIEAIGIAMKRK